MHIVSLIGLGLLMLGYAAFCFLSFIWLINAGEVSSIKPSTWVSKTLYWHGAFLFGSLTLASGIAVGITLAKLAWGM